MVNISYGNVLLMVHITIINYFHLIFYNASYSYNIFIDCPFEEQQQLEH